MAKHVQADTIVVGHGLAGLTTVYELLNQTNQRIILLDREGPERLGGLARLAVGLFLVDSSIQRLNGIRDSAELAWSDWCRVAEFAEGVESELARKWAQVYVTQSIERVGKWVRSLGVKFVPRVQWAEKGIVRPENTLPRFHLLWGSGHHLAMRLLHAIQTHPRAGNLRMLHHHTVTQLDLRDGVVEGVVCQTRAGEEVELRASRVVCAAGGMGGSLAQLKKHWPAHLPNHADAMLVGVRPNTDGSVVSLLGASGCQVQNLGHYWNYSTGIRHYAGTFPRQGIRLMVFGGLWLNADAAHFPSRPAPALLNERRAAELVCAQEEPHSWLIANHHIVKTSIKVSGSEAMTTLRDRKLVPFLREVLLGNEVLVKNLLTSPDAVTASNVHELARKMSVLSTKPVDGGALSETIRAYDREAAHGVSFWNSEPLRSYAHLRRYGGSRNFVTKNQRLLDPASGPLVAFRLSLLSRKSMGGVTTDLHSRVCAAGAGHEVIEGLYAVGECAGFGGGGVHGRHTLEGTFLSGCILNGRAAADHIAAV